MYFIIFLRNRTFLRHRCCKEFFDQLKGVANLATLSHETVCTTVLPGSCHRVGELTGIGPDISDGEEQRNIPHPATHTERV